MGIHERLFNYSTMISITLKSRKDRDPISGQRLSLEFSSPSVGWTKARSTDSSGTVTFQVEPGECTLFLNGGRYLSGWLGECLVVYLDVTAPPADGPLPDAQAEATLAVTSALDQEAWG